MPRIGAVKGLWGTVSICLTPVMIDGSLVPKKLVAVTLTLILSFSMS